MDNHKVAIITTTFYRDNEEGNLRKELSQEFFRNGVEAGYNIFNVDGGTDNGKFIEELNALGVHAYPETRHGLGESRREALEHAFNSTKAEETPYLLWSEPEKVDLIRSIDELISILDREHIDMIVPKRSDMGNYPSHQQLSEEFGNQRHSDYGYLDMEKNDIDTFFGPKIWRREMTPYFRFFGKSEVINELFEIRADKIKRKYEYVIDWSIKVSDYEFLKAGLDLKSTDHMMHMPACLMILDGRKVLSHIIDYAHPIKQMKFEEKNKKMYNEKRLMQLNALDEQFALVKRIHERGLFTYSLI